MNRPIFFADTAPTEFAEHIQAITDAVVRVLRTGEVPEPAVLSVAEHRLTITPWQPGAPLTGLLAWAAHMTDPVGTAQVHPPVTAGSRPLVSIYVAGALDGLPTELVGSSYHELPKVDLAVVGRHQPLDVANIRALAQREHPVDLAGP